MLNYKKNITYFLILGCTFFICNCRKDENQNSEYVYTISFSGIENNKFQKLYFDSVFFLNINKYSVYCFNIPLIEFDEGLMTENNTYNNKFLILFRLGKSKMGYTLNTGNSDIETVNNFDSLLALKLGLPTFDLSYFRKKSEKKVGEKIVCSYYDNKFMGDFRCDTIKFHYSNIYNKSNFNLQKDYNFFENKKLFHTEAQFYKHNKMTNKKLLTKVMSHKIEKSNRISNDLMIFNKVKMVVDSINRTIPKL